MVYLRALRPLTGDYGTVIEGQVFSVFDYDANSLVSRGLAIRLPGHPAAYRETKILTPPETKAASPKGPLLLVSAIMPTADRRRFVPGAIRNFLEQTYPHKELVIIDDGKRSIEDLVPAGQPIRCFRYPGKQTIGQKRNRACELALGEVICHWDDDDRSAPDRIARQVELMQSTGIAVTGYHTIDLYDEDSREGYKYRGRDSFATGTSLCYRKNWWQAHRFEDKQSGEDAAFVTEAAGHLISVDGSGMLVARLHARGTSPKPLQEKEFIKFAFPMPAWAAI